VPKKLLVTGAAYHEHFKDARGFGWQFNEAHATQAHDWAKLMAGKNKVVADINASYEEMFAADANLDFVLGWGAFEDAHTIAVHATKGDAASITHRLSADTILIATGGWPTPVAMPGAELAISSNEAFYLERAPRRALVVGGGYIAVEFASIFESFRPRGTDPATGREFSSPVTLNYRGDLFLRGFDLAVREELRDQMAARGIELKFNDTPVRIEKCAGGADGAEEWRRVTFASGAVVDYDVVMFATGRAPNVASLNLPAVGIAQTADGAVRVDAHSRTNVPHIYSIGDVTNRVQLTPVAIFEGQCFVDTAFGGPEVARAPGYDAIASAVFAIPQVCAADIAFAFSQIRVVFGSRFSRLLSCAIP
jgi:pyruvate/2-oxoglutarate dehydrogenase complex dihydrolipoamide dehydrogenase (E3) component